MYYFSYFIFPYCSLVWIAVLRHILHTVILYSISFWLLGSIDVQLGFPCHWSPRLLWVQAQPFLQSHICVAVVTPSVCSRQCHSLCFKRLCDLTQVGSVLMIWWHPHLLLDGAGYMTPWMSSLQSTSSHHHDGDQLLLPYLYKGVFRDIIIASTCHYTINGYFWLQFSGPSSSLLKEWTTLTG